MWDMTKLSELLAFACYLNYNFNSGSFAGFFVERVLNMKTMRKYAVLCAGCLMLTALPLPAAAAEDDPVLMQLAAVKNDKFTVDAKKLGYTALNGECPERPEWYTMPTDEYTLEKGYANDDEWWADNWKTYVESGFYYGGQTRYENVGEVEPAHYSVTNSPEGYALIVDGKPDSLTADNAVFQFNVLDKNGELKFTGAFDNYCESFDYSYSQGVFSLAEGLTWIGNLNQAYYYDVKSGNHFQYQLGEPMYNGYAAVLECLETGREFTIDLESEYGSDISPVKHQLSLINGKGEKVFTASEPVLVTTGGGAGGDGFGVTGYNYSMKLGGYSEGLIWLSCDRQLGSTLNDLIVNTDEGKEAETEIGWATYSNEYSFAEHKCGYADLQGNIVIPQKFDAAWPFQEGIALVGIMEEGDDPWNPVTKYGFIDKSGNYIAEPQYEYYDNYWNGEINVKNVGTGSFSGGFAKVALKDDNNVLQYGYIDKTGKVAIELQFEDARDFQNGFACVKKDGKWGYINTAGETVVPFEYTGAYGSDGLSFVVGKEIDGETKFGAIDADGNTILPFVFEDMSNPVNGLVYAFCNKELYSMEIAEILDSGDLTGDGDISIDDAQTALKAYTEKLSGKDSGLTPGQLKAADINGDGQLSVEDVQYILIYYTENKVAGKHMTWEDVLNR
ncbi:MAG: WG repeat-containing protein [Oscillospiraceae bacterium]|nr:WG repeat-containing protein [Oscillospiraceae bacterium]